MDRQGFETLCRKAQMEPAARVETRDGTVLIADGFLRNKPEEYPGGYYRTMFVVERGGLDIARDLEFDATHDPVLSLREKKRARIRAASQEALAFMALNIEGGRYAN
jgi:hypothetical protein